MDGCSMIIDNSHPRYTKNLEWPLLGVEFPRMMGGKKIASEHIYMYI
jgi:hypothetical protein